MARGYDLPQRRLVSQEDTSVIENAQVPRSRFTNRYAHLKPINAGLIYPFLCEEVLPGDHMKYEITPYVRMATPLFPLFSNQRVDTFLFFVPNRLVWDNWVKFMGEQTNPGSSIAYTIPQIVSVVGGYLTGTIFDHFGLPTAGQITAGLTYTHSALPFRAYNLIYNEWFRDENIVNSLAVNNTSDGPDGSTDYDLRGRAKSHDYFTTALPWPQKFTAPLIPFSGTAPIRGLGVGVLTPGAGPSALYDTANGVTPWNVSDYWTAASGAEIRMEADPVTSVPRVYADLAQATGIAVNTLRQAWMVQSLLERDARGGTRYVELVRSHFGVINPDFRMQRPEYIGGGQSPLQITPIAQTAPTAGATVGYLGAAGTATGQHRASYAATEHGYIIGLINVKSEIHYQQGMERHWSKLTRYDYYWPALAGLGEQTILRKEIYTTGDPAVDNVVFGYQERWHEYRAPYSRVTGIFRSTSPSTLDAWHLAQRFTAPPVLNITFINDNPPMDRVLAAGALASGQQYLCDIMIHRDATRPIPTFGTPVTLGRF